MQSLVRHLHAFAVDVRLTEREWQEGVDALTKSGQITTDERRAIPVMAPGREDVIPAGAAILIAVMRRWGFQHAVVSETDILDGIAYRMVDELAGR